MNRTFIIVTLIPLPFDNDKTAGSAFDYRHLCIMLCKRQLMYLNDKRMLKGKGHCLYISD